MTLAWLFLQLLFWVGVLVLIVGTAAVAILAPPILVIRSLRKRIS